MKNVMFLASMAGVGAIQAQERPNIILFLVDDMGWQDTSVPFYSDSTALNARYHTPNMERLAAMGVKFTEAYACAISSPTRCSLMSGMNAARHRVTNWTLNYDQKTDAGSDVLQLPEWNYNGIQPDSRYCNSMVIIPYIVGKHISVQGIPLAKTPAIWVLTLILEVGQMELRAAILVLKISVKERHLRCADWKNIMDRISFLRKP